MESKRIRFYKCKNVMCELIYADVRQEDIENLYEEDL